MCAGQKGVKNQIHNAAKVFLAALACVAALALSTHLHFLPYKSTQHTMLAKMVSFELLYAMNCSDFTVQRKVSALTKAKGLNRENTKILILSYCHLL